MPLFSFLLYTLLAVLAYFVYWLRRQQTYWQSLGIPCDEPNLLIGSLAGVRKTRTFQQIWVDTYNKFKGTGPFCGFYFFQKPAAFILDLQLTKNILIRDFNKFTDRGFYSNEQDDPLTGQLFLLDGHKWRNMRNKLSPTFTTGKMKHMFPTIVKVGDEFVRVFGETVQQNSVVEVKDLMARFTTDVIGTCAFGIDCNSLKDPETEFRSMGRKALTETRYGNIGLALLNSFPDFCRRIHMRQFPDAVIEFFSRIVRENAAYREKNNVKRNDFFDMLLELKNNKMMKSEDGTALTNLTIDEVTAQAFVFLVAGFETSSTTMGFALYELALHQNIQERARQEIAEVLEKHKQEFSYECMKEMQYLDQIISETLRLYTVLPMLNRQALEDYIVPGHPKYVIKKGMKVLIPAAAYHRDADIYPNPDEFNPDHFTPEKVKARDSVAWLPFGDGPRNCVGMRFGQMQSRVGLALLLKHFKFTVCPKTVIPMKYDKESFLVASEGGIYLKVERVDK